MSLPINHGKNLRRQFLNKQLSTTNINYDSWLSEKQKANVKKWISYYRRNWDLFCEQVLQIKLYPLQKFSLHMAGVANEYFEIATRGAAKSFRAGIAAMCAFSLYPYSEIVITSSTIPQAAKLVEKKIRDEIIKKLSPYLLYMYENEYIVITKSNTAEGAYTVENKLNGSTITVLPCLESSRGSRSTYNIYEETRLLKPSIISSVFEPMGHVRQAKYLSNSKYNTKRWQEEAKSMYITSARYSYEWFFKKFIDTTKHYYTSKHERFIPFAQDIFTAIEDGSRTWADYRKNKKSMTTTDFRMEILNEMFRINENGYFNIESFRNNQVLSQCFYPPKIKDIIDEAPLSMQDKKLNEIRFVIADLAFSGNSSRQNNDHTVFMCMSLHWKKFSFERHIDYIETRPGGRADQIVLRMKELYYDYQADYLIYDNRSGGETIYDFLSNKTEHPERGSYWNNSGFTLCLDKDIQIITSGKMEELSNRTVDKNAIPCLIPFIGTLELNSLVWQSLKKQLEINNIKFLISAEEAQNNLEDNGEFYKLTPDQYAYSIAPYGQTDELIHECVNLSAEYRNGLVRLKEPRSGFKDRAIVLAYANYIAERFDNRYAKNQQQEEIDLNSIQLIW